MMNNSAILNIKPNGEICIDGSHAPAYTSINFESLGISSEKFGVGLYRLKADGISWPDGWKVSVYKDEMDNPTSVVNLTSDENGLVVECFDPEDTSTHKDITYLITVKVDVNA